ncbi:endonuclease/exonuclease/phosphatase family protein [Alkalimonas sp. MEB108]|uniref:Endonuclease/exonuclease/phosphatase family protein n=1 Tax=Alkalimonas cellulosilytica TaxID=3058395 RepID=A0ABU7J1Q1_9GAMM|nr:endonuclease/exonuclease/phosphatase family protein [Alkalimonas sp. MEB108]MEE2000411.1 endonuclease/exonuclease/phosphatase family protein [Alkalimonas sp. MEB108]
MVVGFYYILSILYWAFLYLPLPLAMQPIITLVDYSPRWLVFLPCILLFLPWFRPKHWLILLMISVLNVVLVLDLHLNVWQKQPAERTLYRFATFNAGSGMAKPADILRWYQQEQLDALLLQESSPGTLRQHLPDGLYLDCHGQLCLLTQHQLVAVRQLDRRPLDGYGYYATHYELAVAGTTFQVVNLHLNTPRHGIDLLAAPRSNYQRFIRFHRDKSIESMIASQLVQEDTRKVIIGGDFNLTQQSRIYREHWKHWPNSFRLAGIGLGHTKYSRFLRARIDHLLVSDDLAVISSQTHPAMGSDHKPLIVEIAIK